MAIIHKVFYDRPRYFFKSILKESHHMNYDVEKLEMQLQCLLCLNNFYFKYV